MDPECMGDIDFEVNSTSENSNKFPKTRFWKEKSVEDVVTLGPMAQATLVSMIGESWLAFWNLGCEVIWVKVD